MARGAATVETRSNGARATRQAAILVAARAVFSEMGYEQASIIEIAGRAGVAEGTIYKYFRNKRDLLYQVVKDFYTGIIEGLEDEVHLLESAADRLRFIVWRHLKVFMKDARICLLFIREIRTDDDYARSVFRDLNRRYTACLVETVERGIATGELRADVDPHLVRAMVYGSVEHVAWNAIVGGRRLDIDAAARMLADTLLVGLKPPENEMASLGAAVDRLEGLVARLDKAL